MIYPSTAMIAVAIMSIIFYEIGRQVGASEHFYRGWVAALDRVHQLVHETKEVGDVNKKIAETQPECAMCYGGECLDTALCSRFADTGADLGDFPGNHPPFHPARFPRSKYDW